MKKRLLPCRPGRLCMLELPQEAQVREENRCSLSSKPVAPTSHLRKKQLRQAQGWCEDA